MNKDNKQVFGRVSSCRAGKLVLLGAVSLLSLSLNAQKALASCSISGTATINSGGVLEQCTVNQGGVYDISAYGGAGGGVTVGGVWYNGSSGSEISAEFSLSAGETLEIVTGSAGKSGTDTSYTQSASGGGGTALVIDNNGTLTALLVAGGGGGDAIDSNNTFSGYNGGYGGGGQLARMNTTSNPDPGTGGVARGTNNDAASGGGFFSSGANGADGGAGLSFVGQPLGSKADTGGAGSNYVYYNYSGAGGGGGGYDGGIGGAGDSGGTGGTNYYNPTLATNVTQVAGAENVASPTVGQLDFSLVSTSVAPSSPSSVPEPPAILLSATFLGLLAFVRYRVKV